MPRMVGSTSPPTSVTLLDRAIPFLRAFPDAAILVTGRGVLLAANKRACEVLGLRSERKPDCLLQRLVQDPEERIARSLRSWARSTTPLPGALSLVVGGSVTVYNATGSVVAPATAGEPACILIRFWPRAAGNRFVLLNQKVAELNGEMARRARVEAQLRLSELALQERVKEAEALNRTKDEFLATVSHELRTPLSAILGWSWVLQRRTLDEEIRKGIAVIHRNAEAQGKLIDDILDVSRIIAGKMLIEVHPADLAALVEEAVDVVRPSAAAKQLQVSLDLPGQAMPFVADPDRIRQAVWNVLSNAVKFTDRGGSIRVTVRQDGQQFHVRVADTGIGIEPAFLPLVFDRFRQADGSTTRRTGGLGLGLALVRSIVELHGGTVTAASDGLGTGATFTVSLPVRAVGPSEAETTVSRGEEVRIQPPDASILSGVKTLVVDDEVDARDLLRTLLTDAGSEVMTAPSVAAAFEVLAHFSPDVLVSDIGMPDENGHSFLQRLRQFVPEAGGDIPAIALSAYARSEDRDRAIAAGFTVHLGKPVSPEELVSTTRARRPPWSPHRGPSRSTEALQALVWVEAGAPAARRRSSQAPEAGAASKDSAARGACATSPGNPENGPKRPSRESSGKGKRRGVPQRQGEPEGGVPPRAVPAGCERPSTGRSWATHTTS